MDLLEALLLAACFDVIEIPVSSFQIPHFEVEVDKIVTRKGDLNCDPLKIILKLKKQFSSSLLGSVKLIF